MKKIISCLLAVMLVLSTFVFIPAKTVYAASDNLALGKPVTASSEMAAMPAININDGDYGTSWARGEYGTQGEWIQIDLLETYVLTSVVLHTRLDARDDTDQNAYKYRTNADVHLSNDPEFETYDRVPGLTDKDKGYGVPVVVKPPKKAYRYVRVRKTDSFIFVLSEVEAFGYPASVLADMAPEYEDVVGSKYESVVTLLEHLGAISPMSETQFGVKNLLTRGQAAQLIVDTFMPNHEYIIEDDLPFLDVDKNHMYYNAISGAYSLGFIRGESDARFNPDANVTPREFATMVLRAMGYGTHLLVVPNPDAAVTDLTRRLDLFEKISGQPEQLSIGNAAIILYNALMSKFLEVETISDDGWTYRESEPMIESLYKLKIYEGVVNETRKFNLVGDEKTIDATVRVGEQKLNDVQGKLDDYLGKNVSVVVYDNSNNAVDLVLLNDCNVEATINAEDIDEASKTAVVEINAEDKKKTYRLSSDFDVVYNNEPYPGFTASDLSPENGTVTFLDNNDDGKYDVVFVNTYEAYYVKGSYSDDKSVSFVDENDQTYKFDKEYLTMMSSDGNPAVASSIKNGVVVKVYKGKNIGETKIIVFSETAEKGKIKSVLSDGIVVNGNTYDLAFGYPERAAKPELGKSVAVFLDENGEVFWLHENTDDTDWKIGFLVSYADKGILNSELQFKIFTEEGRFVMPYAAERVEIDGIKLKEDELSDKLLNNSGYAENFRSKLLRFRLNADGLLAAVDTQHTADGEGDISFRYEGRIESSLFSASSQSFWYYQDFITMADPTTPVFIIPTVKSEGAASAVFTSDPEYDSMYQVVSVLSAAGNLGHQNQSLDMYMRNEEGYPACFMRTRTYAEAVSNTSRPVSSSSAPFMLVKEVEKTIDGYVVSGIDVESDKEASFTALEDVLLVESGKIFQDKGGDAETLPENSWFEGNERRINSLMLNGATNAEKAKYIKPLDDLKFGDIIRYEIEGATASAVERVFDYNPAAAIPEQSGKVWLSVEGTYPQFFLGFNRFQFSKFNCYVNNTMSFDINGKEEKFPKAAFKYVYSVEPFRKTINKESVDGLYAFTESNYRTMIYTNHATPIGLIIYEF